MPPRKKHTDKTIESAIKKAENMGWHYQATGNSAHAWGRLLCPLPSRDGCAMSIWSTPRNAEQHAKQILSRLKQCTHKQEKG